MCVFQMSCENPGAEIQENSRLALDLEISRFILRRMC